MRKTNYLLLLSVVLLSFLTLSCSSDDDENFRFTDQTGSVQLNEFTVATAFTTLFQMQDVDGDYTIEASEKGIVEIAIDGNTVAVKGIKPGTTTLTATDSGNNKATLHLTVADLTMGWRIAEHATKVEIEPSDAEVPLVGKIKKEIEEKLIPQNSVFHFTYATRDEGKLVYFPNPESEKDKAEGTFRQVRGEDGKIKSLVLNYNNQEVTYAWLESSLKESQSRPFITLTKDFTADYSEMVNPKVVEAIGFMHFVEQYIIE